MIPRLDAWPPRPCPSPAQPVLRRALLSALLALGAAMPALAEPVAADPAAAATAAPAPALPPGARTYSVPLSRLSGQSALPLRGVDGINGLGFSARRDQQVIGAARASTWITAIRPRCCPTCRT